MTEENEKKPDEKNLRIQKHWKMTKKAFFIALKI